MVQCLFAARLSAALEACCPVALALWKGHGLATVGEVEEAFARLCLAVDFSLGDSSACRWFLNWFDDADRDTARRELLAEVNRELASRQSVAVPAA